MIRYENGNDVLREREEKNEKRGGRERELRRMGFEKRRRKKKTGRGERRTERTMGKPSWGEGGGGEEWLIDCYLVEGGECR